MILDPVPAELPNPDCSHCSGEGAPTLQHRILGDEDSYPACPQCWDDEEE